MPITNDSLNKDLYRLLKVRGFDPIPKDSEGETSPVPDEADVFRFTFKRNERPMGSAWITVDSNQKLIVYFNDDINNADAVAESDSSLSYDDSWTGFLKTLKMWAQRRQLGFEIQNQDHLASDMAQRTHMKKKENISENKITELAKWRQGYSASGHPAGYKHKSGDVGPIGGTFTDEPMGYGDTKKVPVNKYRDEPDQLAGRSKTSISTTGQPLQKKNAQRNLKAAIKQSAGKHGPVGVLPENEGVAEGFSDIVKGIKRKVAGKEDPKEVEHMYGRIARSAIKHKTPDQAEKDIQRYNRVSKIVNKEGVAEGSKQQLPIVLYKEISPDQTQGREFFQIVKSQSPLWKVGDTFSDDDMSMGSRQVRFVSVEQGVAEGKNMTTRKIQMDEGYYPMGKQASYSDAIPTVKIVLQHTRQIQEGEQRYRNIARIFLENTQGERILCPVSRPGMAQVFARHLAEGGVPNDERWNHIKGLCEEYNKMAGFARAVKNGQFNESAQRLVEAGLNHFLGLRESLGKMRGHRGYNAYFESWTPTLMENEGEETNLNELFVQETLDPRIESVMPILSKLKLNLGEMKEVDELAEWANNVTENEGRQALNPVGIPESEEDVAETKVGNYKDMGATNSTTHFIKNIKTGKVVSPHRSLQDAKDALVAYVRDGNGNDYKIVRARKEGVAEGAHWSDAWEPVEDIKTKSGKVVGTVVRHENGTYAYYDERKGNIESGFPSAAEARQAFVGMHAARVQSRNPGVAEGEIEDAEKAHQKIQTPAAFRKKQGGDWKVSGSDLEKSKARTGTSPEGLAAIKKLAGVDQAVSESASNQEMVNSAETMTLDQFVSVYGEENANIWHEVNGEQDVAGEFKGELDSKGRFTKDTVQKMFGKLSPDAQNIKEQGVAEDLDANQKRVGQLGPTEKVGPKGAVGKLVGANESIENDPLLDLKRLLGK